MIFSDYHLVKIRMGKKEAKKPEKKPSAKAKTEVEETAEDEDVKEPPTKR